MNEKTHNPKSQVESPQAGDGNLSASQRRARYRVRQLEASAADSDDPWVRLSRLMVADFFHSGFDHQDKLLKLWTSEGTPADRLDRAQAETRSLIAISRRITNLVTIEIERSGGA